MYRSIRQDVYLIHTGNITGEFYYTEGERGWSDWERDYQENERLG